MKWYQSDPVTVLVGETWRPGSIGKLHGALIDGQPTFISEPLGAVIYAGPQWIQMVQLITACIHLLVEEPDLGSRRSTTKAL